jgi:repressor LexA
MAVNGFPPTRAEISQRFGYSSNNAADQHLRAIARKGFIELLPTSRKVRLLGA